MSRLYKQITGDNLSDTILEKKMLKAEELLIQHPYMKINEVAERTGFHYAAYFAKVFKKRFGLSPQEYRDQQL
jgi:two-component system response regulator YesN